MSRGLLVEEQRTNTFRYSEDFSNAIWLKRNISIISNNAVAPDGTTTADKAVPTGSSSDFYFNLAFNPGSTATLSIFAKAAGYNTVRLQYDLGQSAIFDLSTATVTGINGSSTGKIENVGNGWYRLILTSSSVSSNNYPIFAIDGVPGDGSSGVLFWGAQSEAGAFATSYIPSLSNSSTTRSADVCQITGGDFSGFWNGTEGSFAVNYDSASPQGWTGAYPVVTFSDSSTNAKRIWYSGEGGLGGNRFYVNDPSGSTTLIATPISGGSIPTKASAAYKQNDLAFSYNGGTPYTGASQLIPSGIDILRIGQNPASGN